ncbi:MAG: peptidoglycan-binding protein [Clostridia bacterium]|nr:peptidoglycan-binding protein [Clostridia bacterium]
MFCSNCGKNLKSDSVTCPYCGMAVGESRFDSSRGYTGAQNRLRPGHAVRVPDSYGNHYSAEFAVESGKTAHELPSDEDSIYRAARGAGISGYGEGDEREPLYNSEEDGAWADGDDVQENDGADAQGGVRSLFSRFRKKAEDEEEPAPDEDTGEELTEEERRSILIDAPEETGGAGISEDVRRFMSDLREEYSRKEQEEKRRQERKAARGKAAREEEIRAFVPPVPEDGEDRKEAPEAAQEKPARAGVQMPSISLSFLKRRKQEENFDDLDLDDEAPEAGEFEDETGSEPEEEEYQEDFEEEFSDETIERGMRRESRLRTLKYVAGALILVLIAVAVFVIIPKRNESTALTQVENVTPDLWQTGTALMQERTGSAYRREMLALVRSSNSGMGELAAAYTRDLDGLSSLMPNDPMLNDQRFINALKAIQESINNCLASDAIALYDTTKTGAQKDEESAARWSRVQDQVNVLTNAKTQGELDSIIKGERVEYIAQATPAPTAAATPVVYTSLQKGSSGQSVMNLQTRLTELGYLNDTIDGSFGNKTKTAVEKFQQQTGLKVTGIADEETQRLLFDPDAPRAK